MPFNSRYRATGFVVLVSPACRPGSETVGDRVQFRTALRQSVAAVGMRYEAMQADLSPATHRASKDNNVLRPSMGMRIRLKASFSISGYPPRVQVILRALKKYGMMVADNGSDWYLSGVADTRWNDSEINALKQLRGSDFEVVLMQGVVTP